MNCPLCQAKVEATMTVCPNCGTNLSEQRGAATSFRSDTVSAPLPRPNPSQPLPGAAKQALFLDFDEEPANIVRVMDEAKRQMGEFDRSYRKRLKMLLWLLPAGLPFLALDLLLGNNFLTFSLVTYVLWGAALVGMIVLRRDRPVGEKKKGSCALATSGLVAVLLAAAAVIMVLAFCPVSAYAWLAVSLMMPPVVLVGLIGLWRDRPTGQEFGPRFEAARTIFETLKDDVHPRRTFVGWLDLSGTELEAKIVQQRTNESGTTVALYRDEWLRMKMPLYDGNLMRVSAVERVKAKRGRWKRGRSGKTKWRPGGTVWDRHELRVAVSVDPGVCQVMPVQGGPAGKFIVEASQVDESRLELRASSDAAVDAWDILRQLRFAYDHVKPRQSPGGAEETSTIA